MEGQPHPYAPRDLKLPGYVPNFLTQSTIVGVYLLTSLLVVSLIWILSGRSRKITKMNRLLMCWWAFTGLTHLILEGYFAFSPEFYKDKTANYLAEVWKEYSKGDSRYAARDAATVTVEGLTAVLEGPASLLAVYAIASGKSYSYILQFAVCLGQLYGTAVYFLTAYLEGDHFATSPYHYYVYYIGANASWVVIPSLIAMRCWKKICSAVQARGQKKTKTR
ncbi:PREDICTED: probable 3-beta-hydroxysteroid-Delta(8),Delta(7)-isomerase [Populus euphratica]|uniref:Probable 3-beta-hydroxysteroid-Delta(8),Delta(7)-isomerase n=1 Tax=Populus euphratica TaxID=75702 RepID=A0AAJ6XJ63_POPEU|nr:PREDICTED: probable 3-beta-hydroxysteroid-Delta(8),Delta(7)-isomerase [Populus euphratica]